MSKILIYDTECNSLDVKNGFIQELAWAVYDVQTWRLLFSKSYLIAWNTSYQVESEAYNTTGLSREYCEQNGVKAFDVFHEFIQDIELVSYIGGHNILQYDNPMLDSNVKRAFLFSLSNSSFYQKQMIDSTIDCPYPPDKKLHALKYLAFDHGYILSDAHQAVADVFACKAIMSKYSFESILNSSKSSLLRISVKIDWDDDESKNKVKSFKFYWNPSIKRWEKVIREHQLNFIQLSLGNKIIFKELI